MSLSEAPGPRGLPLLGNMVGFARDPFAFFEECAETYGDVVRMRIGRQPVYMLTAPEHFQEVLVESDGRFRKPEVLNDRMRSVFGRGLFTSNGSFWRRQRRLVQPAFRHDQLQSYGDIIAGCVREHADRLEPGTTVDVSTEMRSLTLRVLMRTLFGTEMDYEESIGDAIEHLYVRFQPSTSVVPDWVPTRTNRRYRRSLAKLDDLIEGLIAERHEREDPGDDLLGRMLTAETDDGYQMSDTTLRDELMNLLLAGHETTAVSLTHTFYLLGRYPETQRRLQAELDAVLGDDLPTAADCAELTYTEKLLKESIRLYPPAYSIPRETTADEEIGGYHVPEGTILNLCAWVLHRDGRWYDDPLSFRPDRWTDEFETDLPEFAYVPFGGGPRHCIGRRFAMMEAKLAVATIAQRYELSPVSDEPLSLRASITTQPDGPVEMAVRER